jgi:type II secretory pathway pseudopilin PulG
LRPANFDAGARLAIIILKKSWKKLAFISLLVYNCRMSGAKRQKGFTIIEVSLFLAVSALLLATLVFGMQRMIGQMRFNDSVNSLTSYIQSQYEEVRAGVNFRGDETVCGLTSKPGNSPCLVLGKVLHFYNNISEDGRVDSYFVTGDDKTVVGSDKDAIYGVNPKIQLISGKTTTEVQWGAMLIKVIAYSPSGATDTTNYNGLAILRSPISSRVMVIPFTAPNINSVNLKDVVNSAVKSVALIVESKEASGLRDAAICIGAGSSSSLVQSVMPRPADGGLEAACNSV